jgi:poly-gamma-glutamate capsule biosynthesis protein CapA/YwtB (metallophosphatase superfamily)
MKIALVGDVMLGRIVNEVLKHEQPDYPWGDTLPLFQTADVRICNLECVITDVGQPWNQTPKVFHFRTDEKNIEVLKLANIDPVSIANNHVLDYEYEGLLRMTELLRSNGINFAGAGENFIEASAPAIYKAQGTTVGLIACTDNEPDWEATGTKPGIFYVPVNMEDKRAKQLFELIKKTRDYVDILIVSFHWGPNWRYHPPAEHVPFAKTLIDSGADIVFGHSPHIFRGVEVYKKKLILYSAGDFIDDYAVDEVEKNDQSFVFIVEINSKKITKLQLHPTVIRNMQARKAKEPELKDIILKMRELCDAFKTTTTWQADGNYLEITIQR